VDAEEVVEGEGGAQVAVEVDSRVSALAADFGGSGCGERDMDAAQLQRALVMELGLRV